MPAHPSLFSPVRLGVFELAHRVVMPSMTRRRAQAEGVPGALMVEHYRQRASRGGLIVSEPTLVCRRVHADLAMPGLYSAEQVNHWRRVTGAVHERGGIVLVRLAHPVQGVDAREDEVMSEYRSAAENAGDAGFDGVEVHAGEGACAAGPDARALLEVVDTLCGVFGAGRVAVCLRLDADAPPATRMAARELRERPLAFVHLARDAAPALVVTAPEAAQAASGVMSSDTPPVLTPGCGAREAARLIESGAASAVGFDALFVANPDLPRRLFEGLDLARCDAATLLDGAAAGYIDYPVA